MVQAIVLAMPTKDYNPKGNTPMTCKRCGQEHSPNAWKLAVIITNGRNKTRTDYGEKTVCGLAAMIDDFKTDAPINQLRKETRP